MATFTVDQIVSQIFSDQPRSFAPCVGCGQYVEIPYSDGPDFEPFTCPDCDTVTCSCGGEIASRLQAAGLVTGCSDCGKVVD